MSDLEELATLDALGALDEEERLTYVARLAHVSNDERAVIAELYDAAAAVAAALVTADAPSPRVKDALLARASRVPFFTNRAAEGEWLPVMDGVLVRLLTLDKIRDTAMIVVRLGAGVTYPAHQHSGAEECYVLAGDVTIEGQSYGAGDFHHADAGSHHGPVSSQHGVEFLLVVTASDYLGPLQRARGRQPGTASG